MKKSLALFFIVFVTAIMVFSQNITILHPAGGDLIQGSSIDIRWNAVGTKYPFKITLWRNGALMGIIKSNAHAGNGIKTLKWVVGKLETGGSAGIAKLYNIKIKEKQTPVAGYSIPFNIVKKKDPGIGIIELEALKPIPNIPTHRAPAISLPSNASFAVEKIYYDVKHGKLRNVRIMIRYNSKTAFSFNNYQGHPKDGPVYMNCKITIPDWDGWESEPNPPKVIFNQRLSIKYGGKNGLACDPPILNPGTGHFELIFNPDHSGKILGLEIWKDISGAIFTTPKPCKYFYYPKLEIRLFVHTKENVKQVYKQFYLSRTEMQTKKVKGDVDDCHGGQVNW